MDLGSLELKKFEDYGARINRKISLNKSDGFSLPAVFLKEQGLLGAKKALLYYDVAQKVIGIRFVGVDDGSLEGFALSFYGEGDKRGANFIARSFLKKNNIDTSRYFGKYDFIVQEGGEGKIFLIELKEADKNSTQDAAKKQE